MSILLDSGILLCRLLTGATLLLAGIAKMRNGQSRFLQTIIGFDLVPKSVAAILARYLPWIEVLVGALLVVGLFSQTAALTAFGLFFLFSAVITASLLRGKENDCGCLGKLSPVQWRLVYRNVFLMGLLPLVYAFSGGALALDGWLKIRLPQASVILVMATVWGASTIGVIMLQGLMRLKFIRLPEN